MRKITKKVIKRIKAGYHDDLMDAIEFLIDTHNEDKFDAGYRSRISDEAVMAYRLAEEIMKLSGKRTPTDPFNLTTVSKTIEEYFNNALKHK